jgi:5-methylcytosine-specific restriction endonuclease McrA
MRTKSGIRAKQARALFMRRTYSMYKHMCERADKQGQSVPFDLEQLREVVEYELGPLSVNRGLCPYCESPLKVKTFSLDHRIPIERGGSWDLGNNIDTICDPCNRAKGTMTGDEFESVLRVLREMPGPTMRDILGRLKAGGAMRRLVLTKRRAA